MAALISTLLATAAAALLLEARSARAASSEALRLERAHLKAEALLAQALVILDGGDLSVARGLLFEDASSGGVYRQDASGLIDLNVSEPLLLAALFEGVGVEAERATILADRIVDWRDEDDLKRLNGAERDDYADAGAAPPKNRPFVVETEIVTVLGMTPDLVECIEPFVTVHSQMDSVDPSAADDFVRRVANVSTGGGALTQAAPFGRVIILDAQAPISADAAVRLRQWVRLTGNIASPIMVHRAQEDLVARNAPPQRCAAGAA